MSEAGTAGRNLLANIWQSWAYLAGRPGLFSLMLFIALCNFLLGFFIALIGPMVLSFTNAQALGTATSIAGSGMLIGSILMAIWGGPRRLIYGLFGAMTLFGSGMILAGLHPSVVLITCGGFLLLFSPPIANGCIFAIWQRKVVADMQGRIFATARMVGLLAAPLAYLSAGLLAEEVFLPLLVPGGALADTVGQYIGTGAGRGIGLMFIIMGCLSILAAAAGYLYPRLRLIEEELPDVFRDTPSSEPAPAPTPADVQRGKRSSRFSYWHKRKEGGHMQSKSLAKLGGFGSIVLGISYLTLGVAAMFNPALRAESMGQTMGEVFEIFLNNMIWTQIENLSFGIGSLFGLAAILAVSQRVVSLNEGWVRWTSILASLCFVIIAIENLRSLRLLPDIARTYLEADPAVQASLSTLVVVLLDIDPLGYTYAGIGLWLTTVNLLAFRARIWPRQLTSLGMAGGIIYVCMMISDLFEFQMMFLITVMLGSLILAPIWYIWMGVNLLRNRQPQQQPLPAYAQKAT
jgi:hypothetical protein